MSTLWLSREGSFRLGEKERIGLRMGVAVDESSSVLGWSR